MSTRAKENANHSQTKLIHFVTEQILQRKSYKMMALCVENYLPVRGMQAETTRTPENANPSQAKLILFVTEQILQKKSNKMMAPCVENFLPVRGVQTETTRTLRGHRGVAHDNIGYYRIP